VTKLSQLAVPFRWRSRRAAGWAIAIVLGVALLPASLYASGTDNSPICNGHAELCGRRLNEVAFAATHNSMSNSDAGWLWPFQAHGIRRQLNDGIRMLLVDTHTWEDAAQVAEVRSRVPKANLAPFDAAVANDAPRSGAFLCHVICALGNQPLGTALRDIQGFLATHPDEVMGIFFQDGVPASVTAAAFDDAGLTRYVYTHPAGAAWPTLGEMIRSGKRLFVLAEVGGAPPDWYEQGWTVAQDTSFNVTDPSKFDCALNRGKASNPFLLLNHWVARAVPSRDDAASVNAFGFLMKRARLCWAERGQIPNFIAVNFYDVGDVFRVVDALNRVHTAPRSGYPR
jgi:hypothetical protein